MKFVELVISLSNELPRDMNPSIKVLTPSSEVMDIVTVEFERDEENGNDVLWLRTELTE